MTLVRFRVDLPGGHSIGPGKVRLLELLDRHGSISAAARAMRMSYRQAWLLLDDLNSAFDGALFETATGGRRGGGARLTALGQRIVDRYHALERAIDTVARRTLGELAAKDSAGSESRVERRRALTDPSAPRAKRRTVTRHGRAASRRSSRRP